MGNWPVNSTIFAATGNYVALIRETPSRLPFGKPTRTAVAFEDWVLDRPADATAAVARVLQALGDGTTADDGTVLVLPHGDGAVLHPAFVARLTDSEAEAIGLPPATPLALALRSSGLLQRDGFRIDTQWTRGGGAPVMARADMKEARIRHDARDWRIPEPLFATLGWVEHVNAAADAPARYAALAGLKRAIGADAAARIAPDGVIERLRLAYASGFSLTLQSGAGGVDFDPVLFGRERIDAAEDGTTLDEGDDALLPPALANGFARRFRGGDGTRASYLLDDGSILYVDPELTRVLGTVRRAQAGTPEQRRAFAAAPQRHIAEALAASGDTAGDAARLFIETQQFSERVAGIDVWRKPVLPWITLRPNSWLPESFGLRVGEPPDARSIALSPKTIADVLQAAEVAVREERTTFDFAGETVPATQATLAALGDLSALVDAARQAPDAEAPPPRVAQDRYFLQVRDNLEDVGYAPIVPREAVNAAPDLAMPLALRSEPKPHQIDGFRWLTACWQAGMPGALLADDMGLGKTYQALAFLAWVRQQSNEPRPVLIVAPTGLLANWRAEIARHLEPDSLGRLVAAHGAELARWRSGAGRDIDSGTSALDPSTWATAGVVLTTYETMRDYHLSFARQPFAAILYDEAQKLKNPASQITRAAKTLNARFQLALTGTPVENRLQDLWSIFDVVHPGPLGSSKAFETSYPAEPERLAALHELLTQAQAGLPPMLLRRMKEDCLSSLPAKRVRTMPRAMPPRQAAAYDRVVQRALAVKGTGQRGRILAVLHDLRGVSLHPVDPDAAGDDAAYFDDSARLATLFAVLFEIRAAGEKVLIFCESLAMQALLAAEIRRRFDLPHAVARIHGGVTGDARQAAVDVFQGSGDGFDAMILSPKAGGVGLTLTAANHVIHLSRWWNPAAEDQATDRAYRIGQTRDVTVYLPQSVHPDPGIAPSSFDLKLDALMERKRTLSRGLLAPGEEDSDADALFDSIISEPPAEMPGPSPAVVVLATAPVAQPPRIRLGLRPRAVPVVPPPPQPSAKAWPRRVVYMPGAARDLSIFRVPVAADPVRELIIIDPYAAAGERARRSTVAFARLLIGDAAAEPVRLITLDAESVSLHSPESNDFQHVDMHDRWRTAFGDRTSLQFIPRSRRQDRTLHDREVRAITRSGRTLIWDLGHGVDGVMLTRDKCVVTLTEE